MGRRIVPGVCVLLVLFLSGGCGQDMLSSFDGEWSLDVKETLVYRYDESDSDDVIQAALQLFTGFETAGVSLRVDAKTRTVVFGAKESEKPQVFTVVSQKGDALMLKDTSGFEATLKPGKDPAERPLLIMNGSPVKKGAIVFARAQ